PITAENDTILSYSCFIASKWCTTVDGLF
ncbi:MAG: hypothetical protein H6Q06_2905, partial [Acidobacteria bacterium]|nr:hypothetical protein [Acidobacteriota bacterium]